MAQNMALAHAEVVPVTLVDDADIHAWAVGEDTTWRLLRAMVAGCRRTPALNAWFDSQALGVASSARSTSASPPTTEEALFVPVLRNVAERSRGDLRAALEQMKQDVRAHHSAGITARAQHYFVQLRHVCRPLRQPGGDAADGGDCRRCRARREPVAVATPWWCIGAADVADLTTAPPPARKRRALSGGDDG